MTDVFEYLKKYGNISFKDEEFNEIDGLIFSRLSYIDFSSYIKPSKYFSSKNLNKLIKTTSILKDDNRFRLKEDLLILEQISYSSRFKDIFIKSYVKKTDKDDVKQFSATTFFNKTKNNKFLIVSFRGTDGSYTGWKEDFELSYKSSIPAQDESKVYLKKITRYSNYRKVIVTGHSKGGNLAIYASSFLNPKRLLKIYAYDSPGFNKDFLNRKNFQRIKHLIKHYTPQSSIIGRLLYRDYETTIVDSNKALLNQHNLYNWNIENNHFKTLDKFTYFSNKIDNMVKTNLQTMTYDQKVEFVETLFSLVKEMTEDDMIQFGSSIFNFALRFRKVLANKSEETKKLLSLLFKNGDKKDENTHFKVEPIKNKKVGPFLTLKDIFKKEESKANDIIDNDI